MISKPPCFLFPFPSHTLSDKYSHNFCLSPSLSMHSMDFLVSSCVQQDPIGLQ